MVDYNTHDYIAGDWVKVIPLNEWLALVRGIEDHLFTEQEENDYYYDEFPQYPVKALKVVPPRTGIVPEDPWRDLWEVHIALNDGDGKDDTEYGWNLFVAAAFRKLTDEEVHLMELLE